MQDPSILVNSNIKPEIIRIGNEQTPVIMIDDFALDTTELINYALNTADFSADQVTYYPGIRAPLPKSYVIPALQAVYRGMCQVYQVPQGLNVVQLDQNFSLLTKQERELVLLQRMPHFDTSKPYHFAVLHYLNANPHGSTGFFRHLPTGFERISNAKVDNYISAAKEYVSKNGQPLQKYVTGSDQHFELYHEIEYKPNRLVIYPGNLLHSTIVDTQKDIDANPNTGRLTANMFIDFQ